MIVLDTTILVYGVGSEHPLRGPCRALLELVRDGVVRGGTTVEVVQEFAHVRSRRRPRAEAADRAREYARGLSPLVQPDEEDVFGGLDLFQGLSSLGPFDAVLAAAARRRGWALASADRSFEEVTGLAYLDPSSPTFLDEVRAAG
ncbi:MAG: type II toxin-antitoxin system VapC family toxin [Candidatus Dormibacteria bacterium]